MSIKKLVSNCFIIFLLGLTGCSTSINSYNVANDGSNRKGGIPYYMPKPMLIIKQPIETVRNEQVLAVVSLGGVKEFLYPVDIENFDQAIAELEKLIKTSAGSVKLEELKTKSVYKTEETLVTGEHNSKTTKFAMLTTPAAKESQASVLSPYAPADVEKSISVVLIPDYTKEYELVIDPSWFSSLEVGVTLYEGWRLDGFTSKTGENQLIGALKDVATSIIGAQKDVNVAKIGKEQALRLKELEIESAEGGEKALEFVTSANATLRVKGYLKRVSVTSIEPGVYDLIRVIDTKASWKIPTVNSSFIVQLQL
mgnify:CR=1 FL=1